MQPLFFTCKRRRTISLLVGAVALLAFSLSCGGAPAPVVVSRGETPRGRTPPSTSLPMPPTASGSSAVNAQTFTLLDNQRVKLSDYLGQVVVLISGDLLPRRA